MSIKLENRIKRLERINTLMLVMLLVIASAFITASDDDDEEEFEEVEQCGRLEIIDSNGDVIAFVGVDEDGSRGLFIYDNNQVVRTAVIHDENQSAFFAFDSHGTVRVGAAQFAHGGGGFTLHGERSKGAAAMYYKNGGSLTLYDTSGTAANRWPQK